MPLTLSGDTGASRATVSDSCTGNAATATNATTALNATNSAVIQTVHVEKKSTFVGTSVLDNGGYYIDVTGLSATITPLFSTSKILIFTTLYYGCTATGGGYQQSFRIKRTLNSVVSFPILGDAEGSRPQATGRVSAYNNAASTATYHLLQVSGVHRDSPATLLPITYQIQCGGYSSAPTVYINRSETFQNSASNYDTVPVSTITLMEVK